MIYYHPVSKDGERMKDYERIRADISKRFKDEIEKMKLEIIRLNNENADLQVKNFVLQREIQKYKSQLESISDSQKSLLGMTTAIKHLF